MMRLQTGRRLHFGLFAPKPVPEIDLYYGGLGAMVDAPGVVLSASRSDRWIFVGDQSNRVERFVAMLTDAVPDLKPLRIELEYLAPVHQGWGTGTQLALAVAQLCLQAGQTPWSAPLAARLLGRGTRSGIGIAGYEMGGLLLDAGRQGGETVRSYSLPTSWTWVLVEPGHDQGLHSEAERQAFQNLPEIDLAIVQELKQVAQERMVAAAVAGDFIAFAENLTYYNRRAGAHYRSVQHGDYSSPDSDHRLAIMGEAGALGRGQSSWGPGLFAVFSSRDDAESFLRRCPLPECRAVIAATMH